MAEQVQKLYSLSGVWQVRADDGILHSIRIPGTLEENSIGHPDTGTSDPHKTKSGSFPKSDTDRFLLNENLLSEDEPAGPQPEPVWMRFTRRHVYEGTVRISRMLEFKEKRGRRYFFEVERARFLQLLIDEEEIPPLCPPTLSAPQVFEVTGKIDGSHMMTIVSDNHYAKWPGEEIMDSNAASDDTATNWNGLLGYVRIREELPAFPERMSVRYSGGEIFVKIRVRSLDQTVRRIILSSGAFRNRFEGEHPLESGVNDIEIGPLSPAEKFVPWDVSDPKLYEVTALLVDPEAPLTRVSELRIRTGFRTISAEGADLLLNGRKLYLRGEENRSVHPETLYPPMERMAWKRLFMTYRSYGLNYVYFRTHVPPEEAFEAADELGLLLFAELPRGKRTDRSSIGKARSFYESETVRILETGGSHPSFLGLSAAGSAEDGKGQAALTEKLMKIARECDPGCLISAGIDLDSKESSILFVTDGKDGNGAYSKPMVLFHTAVHEMLPDFGELDLFSGILKAEQLRFAEMYVEAVGEKARWKRYVEASGDAMAEEYLTSIRHCLIKKDPAGFTFHGLQDHLGNNGRPGGMLFSHPIPKPYDFADPKRMLPYLGDRVVLADVDRFVYDTNETMKAEVILRDFSGEVIPEPLSVRLYEASTETDLKEALHFAPIVRKESETFYCLGEVTIDFKKVPVMHGRMVPVRLGFTYKKQEWTYDFYAIPTFLPVCPDTVLETRTMTERAWKHLSEGGTVFLTPEVRPMERTRPMFVRKDSPLLKPLGLNDYSDVRFGTISRSPGVPLSDRVTPFLTILRHPFDGPLLTPLFEAGMGGGQVIVSLLNLKDNLEDRTVRMMLARIYDYMDSYDFSPNREIRADELQALLSEIQ